MNVNMPIMRVKPRKKRGANKIKGGKTRNKRRDLYPVAQPVSQLPPPKTLRTELIRSVGKGYALYFCGLATGPRDEL